MNYAFDYIMVPLQIIIFLFTMYYFVTTLCMCFHGCGAKSNE